MSLDSVGELKSTSPLCAFRDPSHHFLFHDEVWDVEPEVTNRGATTASQQACPAGFPPENEGPTARGLFPPLQSLIVALGYQHQM